MKKLKSLLIACAVLAAAWGGQASAAYQQPSSGNGVLLFSAWDPVSKGSFVMGLGSALNDLLSAGAPGTVAPLSFNLAANSAFTGLFPTLPSSLLWNVAAGDSTGGAFRFAYTSGSSLSTLQGPVGVNDLNVATVTSNMNALLARNSAACAVTGTAGSCGSSVQGDPRNINNTTTNGPKWGTNYGIAGNFNGSGGPGSVLNFFFSTAPDNLAGSSANTQQFLQSNQLAGIWTLSSNQLLTYSGSAPAAVPVPAAVWLLGSGLFGLVGVGRRREKAVA